MLDAWVWHPLQGVSTNEIVTTCDILNCTKGFTCCDNGCCPERKFWDLESNHFRIVVISLWTIILLLFICVLLRCFYSRCTNPQHDVRTSDHQTPPDPPSIAPLESIWVTSMDPPPPPYSQVVLPPTPTEPPPPYSLRPEGPAGHVKGHAYATL